MEGKNKKPVTFYDGHRRADHGGNDGRAMTLEDVAKALGVSRQWVHMLEQSALAKMRVAMEERGLKFQDLCPREREEGGTLYAEE